MDLAQLKKLHNLLFYSYKIPKMNSASDQQFKTLTPKKGEHAIAGHLKKAAQVN